MNYRTGRAWRRIRRAVLDRAGWRCERCGKAGRLECHHIVPHAAGGGEEMSNLQALCRGCHFEQHGARPKMAVQWQKLIRERT